MEVTRAIPSVGTTRPQPTRPRGRFGLTAAISLSLVAGIALLTGVGPASAAGGPTAANLPLGDYAGADNPGGVAGFASETGANVTLALDYLDRASGWAAMDSASGIGAWSSSGYQLVLAVPMLPGHAAGTLNKGARGSYDSYFVTLAKNLVADGEGNAYLRLGWEFNGNWYKWSVHNAKQAVAFAAYFRNIVTAMRSVQGEDFKFVWNPMADSSHGNYSASQAYPGNAYVDFIGTDVYDQSWLNPLTAQNTWDQQLAGPWGLDWLATFAADEGKPIVFPEWGVVIRNDGHGLGDDPYFVTAFASWITSHDVAWTDIFSFDDNQQDDITDGSFPEALAAFEVNFG